MPHDLTSAKHVSGAMDSALQYIGVDASEVVKLCNTLERTIDVVEGWYTRACQTEQPIDSDSFSRAPTQALPQRLPDFLQRSLQLIETDLNGQLCLKSHDGNRDRLANELSQDLALLRHAADFVQDIARNGTSDGEEYFPSGSLELFPVCETESDQAFWQSHQDQVCNTSSIVDEISKYPSYLISHGPS